MWCVCVYCQDVSFVSLQPAGEGIIVVIGADLCRYVHVSLSRQACMIMLTASERARSFPVNDGTSQPAGRPSSFTTLQTTLPAPPLT